MQTPSSESGRQAVVDAAKIATRIAELTQNGRFVEVERFFAPRLRAVVSAETLRIAWENEIGKSGPVSSIGEPVSEPVEAGLVRVSVPITCERGALSIAMSVDDSGALQGLRISSAAAMSWTPPPYANQKRFVEREVMIGSGPLAVPGALTLPRGRGPRPGVVLLGGGGPFDRDETSGPNKPLKDLAWGLASRGVAVARFDKVTFVHNSQVATTPNFTMTDEYVPHAVAAVHLLQCQPDVDPARIFILGHSMGGRVAPRVALAEPSVAGLALLAADAQPMQQAAIRVGRYLASVDPNPALALALETIIRQVARVESPDLEPSTPASELPFGLSGAYWLDLRSYDPVSTAVLLDKPLLILQGGRDYQVTVQDDLSRWEAGLGHRPDVTIRVYDADNHLFFPGAGLSTPAEYAQAQHVDPVVVADIVKWLTPHRGKIAGLLSGFKRNKVRHSHDRQTDA